MRDNLIGRKFARLTVEKFSHKNKYGALHWHCVCDCGERRIVAGGNLRSGTSMSCGCFQREITSIANTIHGHDDTPIYHSYMAMKARCYNPNNIGWEYYGGRGIKVCERWLENFENFFDDMMPTWQPGLTIERKNVDLDYDPENCCWATYTEQARNKQKDMVIDTPRGAMHLAKAAQEFGLTHSTLWHRVNRSWPQDRLFDPPGTRLK